MTTFSGAALSGLTYVGSPATDAQYVSPGYAALSTANSGTADADDSPAVFVVGSMGALNAFSANFTYINFSGPNGTLPYWNIAIGSGANLIHIISMGGEQPFDSSSTLHAYNSDYSASVGTWGMTLSALEAMTYNGNTVGDMTVDWAGIEIGDWDNGTQTIPASVDISSITVPTPVPETSTMIAGMLLLLPLGASALRALRRSRTA
jgi:hypothetical protein